MKSTHKPLLLTLLLALAVALAACGGGGQMGAGTAPTTAAGESGDGASAPTTAAGEAGDGASAPTTAAGEASGGASAPTSAASGNAGGSSAGIPEPCLETAEIEEIIGLRARFMREVSQASGDEVVCAYQVSDAELGAFVSIIVSPASESETVMQELQAAAEAFLGGDASAEAIDVGEGGYAYGSDSKSEAAAVAGGRVYRVDITSTAQASIRDKQDAMVEILRRMIE